MNNSQPLRPELSMMTVENFRTFVIHSRHRILGSFYVDRKGSIVLGPTVLGSIVLGTKSKGQKELSATNDANQTARLPILSEQTQLKTRNNVEVLVTHFGKPVAYCSAKLF